MRALLLGLLLLSPAAGAQALKVLTTGAVKSVVAGIVPGFQTRTGVEVSVQNDTAGALLKRIQDGETFDVVVLTSAGLETLATSGKVDASSTRPFARVGIGVAVRSGTALPEMGTVEQFKAAILNARKVAYIDPASGGSSGIYLQGLFQRLGLEDAVRARAVLVPGGLAASQLVNGAADLALQQVSELLSVEGTTVAGMLPAGIQNYTTYAFGIASATRLRSAAGEFVAALTQPAALEVMRSGGIQPVP